MVSRRQFISVSFSLMLVSVIMTACGPSGEELATTSSVETAVSRAATKTVTSTSTPEPTLTPMPTATPTLAPTSTPTLTPTATPTPSPTLTATAEGATVYGDFQVAFIPHGEGAEVPQPPIDLSLIIESESGEGEFEAKISDPAGGFSLNLPAGIYKIISLKLTSSGEDIDLPTSSPSLIVPQAGCVYIGRLSLRYIKLPPLSIPEQLDLVLEMAKKTGQDLLVTVLENGSYILQSKGIDIPKASERVDGAENCDIQPVDYGAQ
jgi:hypothetical protein